MVGEGRQEPGDERLSPKQADVTKRLPHKQPGDDRLSNPEESMDWESKADATEEMEWEETKLLTKEQIRINQT